MLMQGITFNTTMALVAGVIMILATMFARVAERPNHGSLAGWAWAFIATGGFLGGTGFYMTLTWPLKQIEGTSCCAVDNVTFGEPAAFWGLLTFIAGIAILHGESVATRTGKEMNVFRLLRPILYVSAVGGFGLIMIAIAGMHFGMWRPPDIEPIARLMAGGLAEPLLMMLLYGGTGVAALLAPFAPENKWLGRFTMLITWGCGVLWCFVSFTVFYSHVGFFFPDGLPVV